MNKLAHRLTQLRKQAGCLPASPELNQGHEFKESQGNHGQEIHNDGRIINSLSAKIRQLRVGHQPLSRSRNNSNKLTDAQLAGELNGNVLSEGLIYLRSQQPLNNIHHVYNAESLICKLQYWPEKFDQNCEDLLFIDTETTGLSGGVGTLVFLLGVAEISDNQVINHQLLLNGLRGEAAMLNWFNEKLSSKKTLVSYNGKSFDIPLLVNRFQLLKINSPLLTLDHIDLLHWIRRLFKNQWPDCCLPTAEIKCLFFHRKGDVSGAEAPEIWGQLLREGDTTRLKLLLRHHFWDVLSLVGLLDFVGEQLEFKVQKNINVFAVANYYYKSGMSAKAKKLLEINYNILCDKGALLLAAIYRKESFYEGALKIWSDLAKNNHEIALEYLAKHYEHIQKKHQIAFKYTQQLIGMSADLRHVHRKNRLLNKLKYSLEIQAK